VESGLLQTEVLRRRAEGTTLTEFPAPTMSAREGFRDCDDEALAR
jgi:hypothetical protein